jgi:hypothetical protein
MKLVQHPRYENPKNGILNTVIGDPSKQNATDAVYAYYDRYIDQLLQCEKCKRHFYFFAEEQKYWYEDLGFWVDARCIHCIECRIKTHKWKRLQKEYELLQRVVAPTKDQIRRFRVVAKTLIKIGLMKDRKKISKLG